MNLKIPMKMKLITINNKIRFNKIITINKKIRFNKIFLFNNKIRFNKIILLNKVLNKKSNVDLLLEQLLKDQEVFLLDIKCV